MFGEADGFVADFDGVLDDGFECVDGVAGAEFPGVGVHCERHFWWALVCSLGGWFAIV